MSPLLPIERHIVLNRNARSWPCEGEYLQWISDFNTLWLQTKYKVAKKEEFDFLITSYPFSLISFSRKGRKVQRVYYYFPILLGMTLNTNIFTG